MDLKNRVLGNRYKIIEKIGTGGMADVYKATDSILGRIVAVKVLHPQYAKDENFVKRFKREAQSAANLNHPNIVSIYDWGFEGDVYFIVMELLEGKSLKEVVNERGALSLEIIIDVAKQVCSALAFAHKNQIIHRDIKPHNIIITKEGEVKVADFGIARRGASSLTETGSIMGTAFYISPEQAQGSSTTQESDLYSLGVVLYEISTGKLPFTGENAVAIAMKHVQEMAQKPSELNPSIPLSLDTIIMKALAKNPENRYKSANEMKDDLSKLERGIPIKESLSSMDETVVLKPVEKPKPKWQRRITFFLLITLSLLFLVVGSYYILQNVLFGGKVAVPPIKGKTFSEAQSILTKVELGIEVDRREFSEDIPKDTIISQDPESGFKLKKGEKVEVVISKGVELVEVPKIIGELEINAGTILGEIGLKIGEVKREFSEKVQEDTVLNQTPKAGTKVERGSLINIVISKGVQLVLVPDVINKTTSEATSIVSNAGLKYKITEEFSDAADTGHVVRQSPISGTEVKKDTVVEIVISKGEATITMPDVTGKDADDAEAQLTQLGFIVEVKDLETNDPEEFGKVVTQNPIPETSIKRGSVVTIWVGK